MSSKKYKSNTSKITKHKTQVLPLAPPLAPPSDIFIAGHGSLDATLGIHSYKKLPKKMTLYTRVRIGECINMKDDYLIATDKTSVGWVGSRRFHDGKINLFTFSINGNMLEVYLSGIYTHAIAIQKLQNAQGDPFLILERNDENIFMITKEQAYNLYNGAFYPNKELIDLILAITQI